MVHSMANEKINGAPDHNFTLTDSLESQLKIKKTGKTLETRIEEVIQTFTSLALSANTEEEVLHLEKTCNRTETAINLMRGDMGKIPIPKKRSARRKMDRQKRFFQRKKKTGS